MNRESLARRRSVRMCVAKKRYRDHDEAVRVARKAVSQRGVPLRIYECPLCAGFHLTKEV